LRGHTFRDAFDKLLARALGGLKTGSNAAKEVFEFELGFPGKTEDIAEFLLYVEVAVLALRPPVGAIGVAEGVGAEAVFNIRAEYTPGEAVEVSYGSPSLQLHDLASEVT